MKTLCLLGSMMVAAFAAHFHSPYFEVVGSAWFLLALFSKEWLPTQRETK